MKRVNDIRQQAPLWIVALVFIVAGINHFINPQFYVAIMPQYLPYHLELVYLSGFFEIAGGVGVLIPAIRRLAVWGLIALLIAVFPANLHMALNAPAFADIAPAWVLYLRLPLQLVMIIWVWWSWKIFEKTSRP
ncbi:MAG: DoxX family protein [Anaerolineae bacterium]